MNTFTEVITETFEVVSCYTCGVRFGIGSDLFRRVVTNAEGTVYCPACGGQSAWPRHGGQNAVLREDYR